MIVKLLDRDMDRRLGSNGDVDEVMAHPFFQSINCAKLLKKEYKATFIPETSEPLINFDKEITQMDPKESLIDFDKQLEQLEKQTHLLQQESSLVFLVFHPLAR